MRTDAGYWIAWSRVTGVGAARLKRLWEYFGDLAVAWAATSQDLERAGIDQRTVAAFQVERRQINPVAEADKLQAAHVQLVTLADAEYPASLRQLDGAPACLYILGSLLAEDEIAIAVVGNRSITPYGRQVTEDLVRALVRQGVTIVSGLARGVDAVAHRTALAAGGRTLAVLGCGVDITYPFEHRTLGQEICRQGALVSEFPLGTKPDAPNFPMRNRVISGLSLGTLVVEAGESSGALITAARAVEQNREVFAVPGSIYAPRCAGTNALIKRGEAKLVTCVEDILEELDVHLRPQQLVMDAVVRLTDLPINVVSSTLTMLELRGLVRQVTPMCFVRAR
jgi:DNA processing protein